MADFVLAPGEYFVQCPYNTAHQITNARILTHLDKCRRAYMKSLSEKEKKGVMKICRHNHLHHVPKIELHFHENHMCQDAFSVVRHLSYHASEEGGRDYEARRRMDEEFYKSRRSSPPPSSSSYSSRREYDRERDGDRRRDEDRDHDRYRTGHRGRGREDDRHKYRDRRASKTDESDGEVPNVPKPAGLNVNAWGIEEEDWEAESNGYAPGYDPQIKLKSEVVIYNPGGLTKSERVKFRSDLRERVAERQLKGEPVDLPTRHTMPIDLDVKPNLNELSLKDKIKKEIKTEEREPGELSSDDEDDNPNEGGAGALPKTGYGQQKSQSYPGRPEPVCLLEFGERYYGDASDSDDFEGDDMYV